MPDRRIAWVMGRGGIAALTRQEMALAVPGSGQVVMAVRAVSLNYRDLMVIEGPSPYGEKPGLIPVSDGAGVVAAIGPGIDHVQPGDAVVATFRPGWIEGRIGADLSSTDLGGGQDGVLATHVILPAEALVPKPEALSFEEAACFPCAGVTAWNAVFGGSALAPNQSLLVQGTGGVSLFALQFARAAGQRVIATTSSSRKADLLRALGAEYVIDYRSDPAWDRAVLAATGGQGVDRVIEVGGAATFSRSMACTRFGGEISVVGVLEGAGASISPMALIGRMLTVRGISVGSRAMLQAALASAVASGAMPLIDKVFEFDEAREALFYFNGRQHVGKVVIRIPEEVSGQ